LLSVENLSKSLGKFKLKDISFRIEPGQYLVLLGPSAVGKTVLLETIAGLTVPDRGRIRVDGCGITYEKVHKRKIAMVFQYSTLFPHMTVFDNIAYPVRCRGFGKAELRRRVAALARDFAVEDLLNRKPSTLSGGESQRVSLARALASEPRCLLLDEPLCSLDARSRPQMRKLLRKISHRPLPVLHVTHDYTEAAALATHIAVMEAGRVSQVGPADKLLRQPKSEFTARFIGIENFFKGVLEPAQPGSTIRRFAVCGLNIFVVTDSPPGRGLVCIRNRDVTLSNLPPHGSARNSFVGKIVDIESTGTAVETTVDIGTTTCIQVTAIVTCESAADLDLKPGKKIWVSFKASAVQYIEE